MRRSGPPRLNRLPQRLDYTLIPAPLDLSLPLVDEKAALPAIIVTPSSPSGETDFSIAFLAAPSKPSLRERVTSIIPSVPKMRFFHRRLPSEIQLPISPSKEEFVSTSSKWRFKTSARNTLLLAILLFIMACHLIMHGLIASRPHLDFAEPEEETVHLKSWNMEESDIHPPVDSATPSSGGWFNLHSVLSPMAHHGGHGARNSHFIITDIGEGIRPS